MIYFITDGEYVKIGFTESDIETRMTALQIGNARRLRLVGLINGGRETESVLHNVFKNLNVGGEWFIYKPSNQDDECTSNDTELQDEIYLSENTEITDISDLKLSVLTRLRKKIAVMMIDNPDMSVSEVARRCNVSRPTATSVKKMFVHDLRRYSYTFSDSENGILGEIVLDTDT